MFCDWTALPGYVGSDYWAVKNGFASITPFNACLKESQDASSVYTPYMSSPSSTERKSAL